MYPDLSYFFHDIFGTPADNWLSIFKTFGLFLVVAITSSAFLFRKELMRKAAEGIYKPTQEQETIGRPASASELLGNAVYGFFLGFKAIYIAQHFDVFKADPAAVVFSSLGNWWGGILGALLFAALKWYEKYKVRKDVPEVITYELYPHDRIWEITVVAAFSGILGAKLFDAFEHWEDLIQDPLGVLLSGSGLAIYGGLILGFIGVFWYLRAHKIPIIPTMDAIAPSLMLGYGIGRLGCHFSGDGDWGIPITGPNHYRAYEYSYTNPGWIPDWLWSQSYPRNVANDGVPMSECVGKYCMELSPEVFPTPLYEVMMALLIVGILLSLRKKIKPVGQLFFIYLILNGVERYLIEGIRVNIVYEKFGIHYTQAELIAVIFMVIGVLGMIWTQWRYNRSVLQG